MSEELRAQANDDSIDSGDTADSGSDPTAALDALVRRVRRPHRSDQGPPPVSAAGGMPTWFTAAVLSVALVGGFAGWWFLARPSPIESRMPLAGTGSESTGADTRGSGGSGSGGTDSGSAGSAGAGSAGDGEGAATGSSGSRSGVVTVHIAGAVFEPGLVTLDDGSRVADAAAAAGGLTDAADLDRINLAAEVGDGSRVYIPVMGQDIPPEVLPSGTDSGDPSESNPVDLNSADAAALEALPGVGPATAAAIVSHRDSAGPFVSVEALLEVRGIGEAKLEALRDLVSVG